MQYINGEINARNLKSFVDVIPDGNKILELLKAHDQIVKQIIFFKLVIDILENYYKHTEIPLYTKLRTVIFPLAIKFYSRVQGEILIGINDLILTYVDKRKIVYKHNRK